MSDHAEIIATAKLVAGDGRPDSLDKRLAQAVIDMAGENEKLRAKVDDLGSDLAHWMNRPNPLRGENATLREALMAAEEELIEIPDWPNLEHQIALAAKIDEALSTKEAKP